MTSSFQVICKDDEELAIILSAIFGGLIGLGKDKKQLLKENEGLYNRIAAQTALLNDNDKPTTIPNKIDMQFNLEKAKSMLKEEGYVFYKYKKPEAEVFQQRRKRRTKKEMELARKENEK